MIIPLMQMMLYAVPSPTSDLSLQSVSKFELQSISPTYNTVYKSTSSEIKNVIGSCKIPVNDNPAPRACQYWGPTTGNGTVFRFRERENLRKKFHFIK